MVKKEEVVCFKDCKSEFKIFGVIGKCGLVVGLIYENFLIFFLLKMFEKYFGNFLIEK